MSCRLSVTAALLSQKIKSAAGLEIDKTCRRRVDGGAERTNNEDYLLTEKSDICNIFQSF